jgi:hypothetical protein
MDFYTLAALPLSAERGWPELLRARPGGWHLFLQIVLPVALLPPAVLYLAGTVGPPGSKAGSHPWGELSMLVLLAEFGSVALAGRLLRHIAGAPRGHRGCGRRAGRGRCGARHVGVSGHRPGHAELTHVESLASITSA